MPSTPENQSAAPPAKRARRDYNDTLKVLVGPKEEEFTIHVAAACAKSSFFKAACSKEWLENKERVVRLPEHEPEAFEVFVHWIYSQELDISTMSEPDNVPNKPSYLNCGRIWALALYLQSPALRTQVNDCIVTKLPQSSSISCETLQEV